MNLVCCWLLITPLFDSFDAEISFLDHRPSVVAAAAVLAAFDGGLTQKAMELKMDFISTWGSLENVSFVCSIITNSRFLICQCCIFTEITLIL